MAIKTNAYQTHIYIEKDDDDESCNHCIKLHAVDVDGDAYRTCSV